LLLLLLHLADCLEGPGGQGRQRGREDGQRVGDELTQPAQTVAEISAAGGRAVQQLLDACIREKKENVLLWLQSECLGLNSEYCGYKQYFNFSNRLPVPVSHLPNICVWESEKKLSRIGKELVRLHNYNN
jgi:hypothetical protein